MKVILGTYSGIAIFLGTIGVAMAGGKEILVEFTSTPPGASVSLDDKILCKATPCRQKVTPGEHELVVRAIGYEASRERISLSKSTKIERILVSFFGWLTVHSEPSGLEVKINGTSAGKTPIDRLILSPAQYDVVIEDSCYHYVHEVVRIERGKESTVTGKPQIRLGTIRVKGHTGEDLFVDGVQVGTAPGTFYVPDCSKSYELRQGEKAITKSDLHTSEEAAAAVGATGERWRTLSMTIPDFNDPDGLIQGSLSMQEIRQVVHSHHDQIGYCYSKELTNTPGLQGKINMTWTIDKDGTVTEVKVKDSTLSNPTLEQCFLSEIKKWKFPAPQGGGIVIVRYPFILSPAK